MDRFQRNRSYSRPYQTTCGENPAPDSDRWGLQLAMAYVPVQEGIRDLYEPEDALRLGTIFSVLCKPFCGSGKRGGGR